MVIEAEKTFGLEIRLGAGLGPASLTFRPGANQAPLSLGVVLGALGQMLGIEPLRNLAKVAEDPWKKIFDVSILPELTVVLADNASAMEARFLLYSKPIRQEAYHGLRIADYLPSFITIEPDITIYDLIVSYRKDDGLDLRARIKIWPQASSPEALRHVGGDPTPPPKTEIVKYPFPTPSQGGPLFQVNYLGLGQHFGPPPVGPVSDPIEVIFKELQNLRSNDPASVLNDLVAKYYHPDRNWFFGADIEVKGWRVQAIFNDPAMYGLRVTCSTPTFEGFKFEILYQKLGPDLGVYYGAVSVPEKFRNVNLGAVALKLPTFEIWIYTNGDFKLAVGWPLGPNSIGFEIYIFIGGCAFYIAKLRTGFNPRAAKPVVYYNPIIAFGLAVKLGLGRTLNAGPLRAELSLTLQGVFQGILAWEGTAPKALAHPDPAIRSAAQLRAQSQSITRAPDYFWFSATVGIVGVLQGEVDLKILKVGVLIRLSITAGLAFETGYAAIVQVTATVRAEAYIKILFVKISISFSLTLTETFRLSDGATAASIDGPLNPDFQGVTPGRFNRAALGAMAYDTVSLMPEAEAEDIDVRMVLFPAAVYRGGAGQSNIVALPMIDPALGDGTSAYDRLLLRYGTWLLRDLAPDQHSWDEVLATLGQGRDAAPDGFEDRLFRFLEAEVTFTLHGVDLAATSDGLDLLPLPMFPPLAMTPTGASEPIVFAQNLVPDGYEAEVRRYFDDLSLVGGGSNPGHAGRLAATVEERPRSFVELMFTEFFLMIGRDMARRLAAPPPKEAGQTGDVRADILGIATQIAGMATRTLLGGVLLPDPKATATPGQDLATVDLLGFFEISQQMVPAVVELGVNPISFALADPDAPLAAAIRFADGSSAVSKIPVAVAPPAPNPRWHGPGLNASLVTDITVAPLPPVDSVRRWFACRDREAWDALGTSRFVMIPPPELQALADAAPLTLLAQRTEPEQTAPPRPDVTVTPGLFIQFRIRRVSIQNGGQVDDAGKVGTSVLRGVYEISATDAATRDRIGRLLDGDSASSCRLFLLRNLDDGGYTTIPSRGDQASVFLFKTNLSTLTQPDSLFATMARAASDAENPDDASIANPAGFLRLIWEASVVNASGFYLHYDVAGDELPDMFDDTGTATLTILAEALLPRALGAWDNALLLPGDVPDTVFIAAETATGQAIEAQQPAYPPGCIGFTIDWRTAPSLFLAATDLPSPYAPDTIAALYDMVQYCIEGTGAPGDFDPSLWSLPLSRTRNGDDGGDDGGPGSYRQVVPVARFVSGGQGDIYAAIGKTPKLGFRLIDTYGNALAEAAHSGLFPALYRDPLVPLGEWPGTRLTYQVRKDDTGGAVLMLVLDFQPGEIIRPDVHQLTVLAAGEDDKAQQQARLARHRYALILAQLRDPNVGVRVNSSLVGSAAPLSEAEAVKTALGDFAAGILAALDAYLAGGALPGPAHADVPVPFDRKRLQDQPETVFAVTVTAEIARSTFVDAEAAARIPAIARALWQVPPDLDPPAPSEGEEPAVVDLRRFAERLEAALEGFDGETGTLKLAVPTGAADLAASDGSSALWGVKLSKPHGLDVSFAHDGAAYFALVPISTRLEGQEGVAVTLWDATLTPRTEVRTFSGIDIDAWARSFLQTVDALFSPGTASAIIRTSAERFPVLTTAKRLLAECLKAGVEPVLMPAPVGAAALRFGPRPVIEGDLEAARDRFEQQVLSRLAAGYDSLVVLQVPATVSNAQQDLPPRATAPRIFGGVTARSSARDIPGQAEACTVTSTRLPIVPPPEGAPCHASFLVSAVNPGAQTALDLDLVWQVGFVEHQIGTEGPGGYVPSRWLRIVDSPAASRLGFALDPVSVPLPTIGYPNAPRLASHVATQNAEGTTEDLFGWHYTADVVKPDRDAKDTLFARLTLNERVEVTGLAARLGGFGGKGDVAPLFAALARFATGWPGLQHLVEALTAGKLSPDLAEKLCQIVEELVRDVAIAWAGFRGVPLPPIWAHLALAVRALQDPPPDVRVLTFALDFAQAYRTEDPRLVVTAEAGADIWPLINGVAGLPGDRPDQRIYAYAEDGGTLKLDWPGLDALEQQTARLAAWILRNSNLGTPGETVTNEHLIYRTAPTTFASPVIPRLRLAEYRNPVSYDTLEETLFRTYDVVLGVGSTIQNKRSVKLETGYEYTYIADPRRPGMAVTATAPLLLRDFDRGDSAQDIARKIAEDLALWYRSYPLPTSGADLVQKLTLFADIQDVHQPILTIDRILFRVPDGWWKA